MMVGRIVTSGSASASSATMPSRFEVMYGSPASANAARSSSGSRDDPRTSAVPMWMKRRARQRDDLPAVIEVVSEQVTAEKTGGAGDDDRAQSGSIGAIRSSYVSARRTCAIV